MSRLTIPADDPTTAERPQVETVASPVPRFLLRRREAARSCGLSPAAWDRLVSAGKAPAPVRLGGALCWRVAELAAWVSAGCPDRDTWKTLQQAWK
jgi:predicted DNA-binding transcriptional regulator AlpA